MKAKLVKESLDEFMGERKETAATLLQKIYPSYRNGCPKMMSHDSVREIMNGPDKDIIDLFVRLLGGNPDNIRVRTQDLGSLNSAAEDDQKIDDVLSYLYNGEDDGMLPDEEMKLLEPHVGHREDIELDEEGRHKKFIDLAKRSKTYNPTFDWYICRADINNETKYISIYYGTSLYGPNYPGEDSLSFFYDPT